MASFSLTEEAGRMKKRLECLEYLAKHTVNVGLTSKASDRSKLLLAVHTHGSPAMRIPPRPVVQPALQQASVRKEMAVCMEMACEAVMEGDPEGTKAALEEAGKAGAAGIRAYIDAGIAPSNAPVTLSSGWLYNRVAKKGVKVKGKSGTTPLVDTGQLRDDFGYEIAGR